MGVGSLGLLDFCKFYVLCGSAEGLATVKRRRQRRRLGPCHGEYKKSYHHRLFLNFKDFCEDVESPEIKIMSSSAITVNYCERGISVQQPSTGTHVPFFSLPTSVPFLINYTEPTGRHGGTRTRSCINTSSPTSKKDTGVSDTRSRRQMRTHPTAAVEQNRNEGNTRRRRQERISSTSAVEPTTSGRNMKRRMQRRTPDTDDGDPGLDEENVMPSRPKRTSDTTRSCINTSSPTSKKDTGVSDTRSRRQMRTHPTAAVEQNTNEGNTRRRRQERISSTSAVEPTTSGRNKKRRMQRRTPDTDDGEPGIDEENAMPSRPRRTSIFERDLTPGERAIPDTTLLHNLGDHLSAYARAGRGPPTQNLNCRGAWPTAVELYRVSNDQYKALFIAAGFGDFLKIEPVDLPVAYSLALMERWFSETNTLHLPCGEICPTPLDWTMVTGIRFGGQCIGVNTEFPIERALDLLGKPGAKKYGKILLSEIAPTSDEVKENPPTDDAKEKVFRRLFLYVVSSCFFNNDHSLISHKLVECLERIDEVGTYDWGEITYSAFLGGMRRKVTAEIGSFTAFWQFLPYWAFEYLDINRPTHIEGNVFPRAKRWICPKKSSKNDSPHFFGPQFLASRCQLNFVEESQVTWEPYLASADYISGPMASTVNLAKKRIPFRSIETWEYYLGERCLRQFGFPRQVPNDPPQMMHGIRECQNDDIWNGISAENLVNQSLEYSSWFATASVGGILNVNPFLGGVNIAEKVLRQWTAKHQPDFILISQTEYSKMKEDRYAVEEECAKLQRELMSEIAQPKAMNNVATILPSPLLSGKASIHPEKYQLEAIKLKPAVAKELVLNNDNECIAIDPPPPPSGKEAPRLCELAVDSRDNKVAYGVVFPHEEEMSDKIHGSPMQPGCLRVSVYGSIKPDALLPIPILGEMEKVSQAVGSHIAWPQNLIIFPTDAIEKKEVLQSKKDELDELQRMQTLFYQTERNENVPEHFRTIFLLHENLIALFKFEKIGQAIISTYMMHLHTMIRESGKLETFYFFDPVATFQLNDDFKLYVVNRMREGNVDRIFFLPHCSNEHWILTIIWDGEIFILDPLPPTRQVPLVQYPALEKALIGALKIVNAETGRGNKVPEIKYLAGSPKQPGGVECGYVVMRYMKDIIEDKELCFPMKWNESWEFYTKEELDVVRFEALNRIQNQLISQP
ncbi:hypothetical protein POM88_004232 [Heracleum sosnowskyi]|uniref:Ubiquitin-like protease family profile domain-containing protein n=1 Tax=Heracleum sosnowskyi TaxID=360622 RepID=A0AAD8ND57_9APIA|nr:hypothetical protein POM88_004232 [Heracleum sosnowskyi]